MYYRISGALTTLTVMAGWSRVMLAALTISSSNRVLNKSRPNSITTGLKLKSKIVLLKSVHTWLLPVVTLPL